MSDIALKITEHGFDFGILNGDLEQDDGLETALLLSLFSDARITDEELPQGHTSKRGFWADKYSDAPQDRWGSRLWLLEREKRTTESLRKTEDFIRECLNWLIEDGVASSITAVATFTAGTNNAREVDITIQRPIGRTSRFQLLWDKQILKRLK